MTAQETNLLNAFETTLTGTIGASDLTITVNSVVDSASNTLTAPCYLVLNPDSATNREVVLVSSINVGTKTLTISAIGNRYLTGSAANSGLSHASGSVVRMSPLQQHIEDLNDRIDAVPSATSTTTFTNKTIDADNNTISNLEVDNLKAGVLDTDLSSTAGTDTTLPSAKAVKSYVDTQITAEDLDVTADSGGPISIDLDSETLDIAGGTGIDTSASGNEISIAVDSTVVTESSTDTLTNKSINLANNTLTTTLAQLNTAVSDATVVDLDDTQTLTNKTINLENNTAIVEFAVTVANPGSGNRYYLDGEVSANIQLVPGVTYRFDQSDGTNSGHPLRLSTTKNGTHGGGSAYTTGVTINGTAGSTGSYTQIVVDAATADNLYYFCTSHSQMGGDSVISINTSGNVAGSGLSLSANTFAIDIPNLSNEGTADNDDLIIIYDDTASGLKKQTRAAFLSGTGVGNMNSFTISDGSTSQTISDGNTITFSGTSNEVEVAVSATDTVTIGLPSSITANLTGNVTGNVSGTSGSTTGNAATATALQTARNIGGVSFDGTGNIDLPGVNSAGNQNTSGTAAGLSATLTVASGGTGATSFADKSVIITQDSGTDTLAAVAMDANGELLIGGTSGPAVATLTAGTGVTITNGDGTIEISAPDVGDISAVNTASNSGLAGGATSGAVSLTIDPSNLADGSGVTVDTSNDFLIMEDVTDGTVYKVNPDQIASGSANALVDGDSDFTITDGVANGIHYELDNTDMADWNQAGVVLTTNGGIFQHHQTQAATYSIPASTGSVMAGPVTITGTLTNNGTLVVI